MKRWFDPENENVFGVDGTRAGFVVVKDPENGALTLMEWSVLVVSAAVDGPKILLNVRWTDLAGPGRGGFSELRRRIRIGRSKVVWKDKGFDFGKA